MLHTTRIFTKPAHFTLSLTSNLTTLTKVPVTLVCHKHVLVVPSRIVLVYINLCRFINFAGFEEFVGQCEVLFKQAELWRGV